MALSHSSSCYSSNSLPTSLLCPWQASCPHLLSCTWQLLDQFRTVSMAWLLRDTFPFFIRELDTRNQSTMNSLPPGPHTSGFSIQLSTGTLSPLPEGSLCILLLWSPPTQLSTGTMNDLNIHLTQICKMCTMSPDSWQRGNFMKQVSTGRWTHHIVDTVSVLETHALRPKAV